MRRKDGTENGVDQRQKGKGRNDEFYHTENVSERRTEKGSPTAEKARQMEQRRQRSEERRVGKECT